MARQHRPRPPRGRPAGPRRPATTAPWPPHGLLHHLLHGPGGHREAGRHVEQLTWRWSGPLDTERFTAAWQSVIDRESVLRAALHPAPAPRLILHDRARADVVRHRAGSADWERLLERERLRGFDLRRPAPLRITLLDLPGPCTGTAGPVTRVVLTFPNALLDAYSVHLLLEEFCRAYLAGGTLPGGERRPDLRDWTAWLQRQDTAPAHQWWRTALPAGPLTLLPARPGPPTGQRGPGRVEVRLGPREAARLHHWAALRCVPDSSAVQMLWALLLYRAAADGPVAAVGFGVAVSGRGIALEGAERLPGPLRTCLPMAVRVDPRQPLALLLAQLRDRALDMAAYEWVSTARIHRWSGRGATATAGGELFESLVSVESVPRPPAGTRARLAAAGAVLEAENAGGTGPGGLPLALLVHPGADGSLTFALVHDRSRVCDRDAHLLADHLARLLDHLPRTGERTTTATVLDVLRGQPLPAIAPRPRTPAGHTTAPRTFRLRPRRPPDRPTACPPHPP
ncbi:condensation domain-containing protein [Streptomyces sp. NPDC047853]|uniref:condensation domain-containing protein n=1 Tax=unclassified Streptomyces TaxID=2593676 RepID=UPI00345652F1